jgi:hypothetical protein
MMAENVIETSTRGMGFLDGDGMNEIAGTGPTTQISHNHNLLLVSIHALLIIRDTV